MEQETVFTKVVLGEIPEVGKFYVFYSGDNVMYCYHENDLTSTMGQTFFICRKLQNIGKFVGARLVGKNLYLKGVDNDLLTDLNCKLINYQIEHKIYDNKQIILEVE